MARTDNLTNFLTDVADSIREKKGTSEPILASDFDIEIANIQSGGSEFKINNASYLFYRGARLDAMDELVNLISKECTNFSDMFAYCSELTAIPSLDTSNATDFSYMFEYCVKLTEIPCLDAGKVENVGSMLPSGINVFTTFGGLKDLGKGYSMASANYYLYTLNLAASSNLTYESVMNVINNLYDLNLTYNVANGGTLYTQTLKLGTSHLSKLTAEEIAIATNKGWTVS